MQDFAKLHIINGMLYRKSIFEGSECEQLVIPKSLCETIFQAYDDGLGHKSRTLSMIKRRFFWTYMD